MQRPWPSWSETSLMPVISRKPGAGELTYRMAVLPSSAPLVDLVARARVLAQPGTHTALTARWRPQQVWAAAAAGRGAARRELVAACAVCQPDGGRGRNTMGCRARHRRCAAWARQRAVARAVVFLASSTASYISGRRLPMGAGRWDGLESRWLRAGLPSYSSS